MRFGYILSKTCIRVVSLSLCTCLVSCKYLFGEPLEEGPIIGIELTVNGEHFEDTAYGEGLMTLDLAHYSADFYSYETDPVYVWFNSSAPYINLSLVDFSSVFVENKKYDYKAYDGFSNTKLHGRVEEDRFLNAEALDGWYLFSRKPNNPYDGIVVYFEFDCLAESGDTVEVRDGVLTISRKFIVHRDTLLVKEPILNE